MSRPIFLILNAFLSLSSFAQSDLAGKWETNDIIGYTDSKEYSLIQDKDSSYGRSVTFNLDGTFVSNQVVECLNDCFVFTSGTYSQIDSDHIKLILENVRYVGLTCGAQKVEKENQVKDLGVFYVYKQGNSVRLIPSNGVLQEDKDKMLYAQLLNSFAKEWKSYDFKWRKTNTNVPEEIVKDSFGERRTIDQPNARIVSSKDQEYGVVFLLKENEKFYYVVYNEIDKKVSLAYPKNKSLGLLHE